MIPDHVKNRHLDRIDRLERVAVDAKPTPEHPTVLERRIAMTNRTRLDSLTVGERFKFSESDSKVYVHLGFHPESNRQLVVWLHPTTARLSEGSEYVIPLDAPPTIEGL